MSNARKLQTEIDRVLKKVDEGVELFDDIWEKVYSAEQQSQKEKFEVDLKKEIKKLQRLRDQIKSWIGSSEVKDKDTLIETRKLIETKMEQFKVCEKETKTKTYSKEGLARTDRLSPDEQARMDTCEWVGDIVKRLQECVEEREVAVETLLAGKGKKTNKHQIDEHNEFIANHKFHINKLEGIMRLVMNEILDYQLVEDLKEELEYYVDSHDDEEYMQSYDQDFFYDSLGLDELDVVNVDRVTQAGAATKSASKSDDATADSNTIDSSKKSKKSTTSATTIPLTIGRAKKKDSKKSSDMDDDKSVDSSSPVKKAPAVPIAASPSPTVPPARAPPAVVSNNGTSMAAILKRETEQQEKVKQAAALQQAQQQRQLQEQQARAQEAEMLRQQQLRQQQEQLKKQDAIRQQQLATAAAQQKSQQEAQQKLFEQQRLQQETAAKQQQLQAQQIRSQSSNTGIESLLSSGLGNLNLGSDSLTTGSAISNLNVNDAIGTPSSYGNFEASASYLGALDESYIHCPTTADSERPKVYTPRNPYNSMPSSYPTSPSPMFDNPSFFEKLGTDSLFFIFYYSQGTYQQYLAARELKKQSWRYHKKYMTWFQRHEEPKVTTEEYEQGTYVYFDYESGWCQRIKSDFRFEYAYLEDTLSI